MPSLRVKTPNPSKRPFLNSPSYLCDEFLQNDRHKLLHVIISLRSHCHYHHHHQHYHQAPAPLPQTLPPPLPTLTAVGLFRLPAPQSGSLSRISSRTRPSVRTVSDGCLKRTCSLDTSAFSVLEVLNNNCTI